MKKLIFLALVVTVCGCASNKTVTSNSSKELYKSRLSTVPLNSDQLIAFNEERVKNDPQGAIGLAMLSEAYLAKARERDDTKSAIKAEAAARRSLTARRKNNSRAATRLAQSLLEQHRFAEGLEAAKLAVSLEPDSPGPLRLKADILLELGRYEEFKQMLAQLPAEDEPSTAAMMARWCLVNGENDRAVALMRGATQKVAQIESLPPQTASWFFTKSGDVLVRTGEPVQAAKQYHEALRRFPKDYRAIAGLARAHAELGEWVDSIKWGESTLEIAKMTNVMGLLVDAYAKTNQIEKSKAMMARIDQENAESRKGMGAAHGEAVAKKHGHTHDRLYAMYLADQLKDLRLAHHIAEEDLQNRQDIYAYDAFAWTTYLYYKHTPAKVTGEGDFLLFEAKRAMKKAMATGCKEPELLKHAQVILNAKPNSQ
ncbi:MAG: tetratricopeptide repeat protein [Fimbriimonadaceae bacterium]